jgi:hypothetical protein
MLEVDAVSVNKTIFVLKVGLSLHCFPLFYFSMLCATIVNQTSTNLSKEHMSEKLHVNNDGLSCANLACGCDYSLIDIVEHQSCANAHTLHLLEEKFEGIWHIHF